MFGVPKYTINTHLPHALAAYKRQPSLPRARTLPRRTAIDAVAADLLPR
jgi:hypothetical protein